jgi:glycolate oxidase iron-sulfur subunit
MQTRITPELLNTHVGQRADEILRKCVHCGFCTATCPTYQLLGDELDGPRGRIYQIKQMFEGAAADRKILTHLDRCLSCRSCETTCPSGVDYAELLDLGRFYIEQKDLRPGWQRLARQLLGNLLPEPKYHRLLFKTASWLRPLMPASLKQKAPIIRPARLYTPAEISAQKTVLLLQGCAQSTLSPNTNAAAKALLQALGYNVIVEPEASCCGAVNQHLNQLEKAEQRMLHNLQKWQKIDQKQHIDAIVSTASGCGLMLKDYPKIIQNLPQDCTEYGDLIARIRDISELFDAETLRKNQTEFAAGTQTVAYHAPCTLTHGQHLSDRLFQQLSALGYRLEVPDNAHLCCGSAGTYSLLQPALSKQLRNNKLDALQASSPGIIITANVGCEHHLNSASNTPVIHWVELVAGDL